jgi:hypothetical protein
MSYLELPETLVTTLNAYARGRVTQPVLQHLQKDLESSFRRLVPRTTADEINLANACFLADQLFGGLAQTQEADQVLSIAYALNAELGKLGQAARGVTYVTIPELDHLLVTAQAIYQGQMSPKALEPALRTARAARVRLTRRYKLLCLTRALKTPLKGEVRNALRSLSKALKLLRTELVKGAVAVRQAAEILEPLERGPRALPVEGLPLDVGFILAKIGSGAPSQALTDEYYQNWHDELVAAWADMRDELVLAQESAEALTADVDDALSWMHESLELEPLVMKEAAIDFLEAWQALMDGRLLLEPVWGTGLERLALAVLGAWKGTVPNLVVAEVVMTYRSVAWNAEIKQLVGLYLRSNEKEFLLRALESILRVAPSLHKPETYLLGRQCIHCHEEYGEAVDCSMGECHCYFEVSA